MDQIAWHRFLVSIVEIGLNGLDGLGLGLNDLGLGLDGLSLNFIHGLNFIAN